VLGIAPPSGLCDKAVMDALDNMISEKRAEAERLREQVRVLEAELAALQLAAQLRPAPTSKRPAKAARSGGGRRPGDISRDWRAILGAIYSRGNAVSYEDVAAVAAEQGNDLAPSSVRDRVRNMVKTGLMEGNPQDGFTVTEDAAERFDFAKENEGAAAPSDDEVRTSDTGGYLFDPNPAQRGA
jgi:uncharacterized coiled-coil protein SlyX